MPSTTLEKRLDSAIAALTARVERMERATKNPPDESRWGVARGLFEVPGSASQTGVPISFGRLRFNDPPLLLSGGGEQLVGTGGDGVWAFKATGWTTDSQGAYIGAIVTATVSVSTTAGGHLFVHWCAMGFLRG